MTDSGQSDFLIVLSGHTDQGALHSYAQHGRGASARDVLDGVMAVQRVAPGWSLTEALVVPIEHVERFLIRATPDWVAYEAAERAW